MNDQRTTATVEAPSIGNKGAGASEPAKSPQAAPAKKRARGRGRTGLIVVIVAILGVGGYFGWQYFQPAKLPAGFASSNGRIEATEIDVATKIAGRILDELVNEGDLVSAGQALAHMDVVRDLSCPVLVVKVPIRATCTLTPEAEAVVSV